MNKVHFVGLYFCGILKTQCIYNLLILWVKRLHDIHEIHTHVV